MKRQTARSHSSGGMVSPYPERNINRSRHKVKTYYKIFMGIYDILWDACDKKNTHGNERPRNFFNFRESSISVSEKILFYSKISRVGNCMVLAN